MTATIKIGEILEIKPPIAATRLLSAICTWNDAGSAIKRTSNIIYAVSGDGLTLRIGVGGEEPYCLAMGNNSLSRYLWIIVGLLLSTMLTLGVTALERAETVIIRFQFGPRVTQMLSQKRNLCTSYLALKAK